MTRLEQRIEWEKRIEAFKESGFNATAWCRLHDHDLKPHQFNYYLYKNKPQNIPLWAKGAVTAIKQLDLIEGIGANKFNPEGETTRAEAVTVLLRLRMFKS